MVAVTYGVHQTEDEASSDYDGTGFQSSRSSTGSYTHQFTIPGVYYFSSGFIDQSGVLEMKGKVIVEETTSKIVKTDITVAGMFPKKCI